MATMATNEARGRIRGSRVPGLAKGWRGVSTTAVIVSRAAKVEVGPLGDITSAGDAAGVGAKKVGFAEGRRMGHAGEDDEEKKEKRSSHKNQACEAKRGVCQIELLANGHS